MVETATGLSRQNLSIEKLPPGASFPAIMRRNFSSSREESREELNSFISNHNATIRGLDDKSIPRRDTRVASVYSENNEVRDNNSEQTSYAYQRNANDARSTNIYNRWEGYSSQIGGYQQSSDPNVKNIWSLEQTPLPRASECSFSSKSKNSVIGTFSADVKNSHFYQLHPQAIDENAQGISDSLDRLKLSEAMDMSKASGGSISTSRTYNSNTIPGVVGASSGSTSATGESSWAGPRYQSSHAHVMSSTAKAFYPAKQSHPPLEFAQNMQQDSNDLSDNDSYRSGYQTHNNRANSRRQPNRRRDGYKKKPNKQNRSQRQHGKSASLNRKTSHNSSAVQAIMNPPPRNESVTSDTSLNLSRTRILGTSRIPPESIHEDGIATASLTSKSSKRTILPSINDIEMEYLCEGTENGSCTDGDEDEAYLVGAEISVDGTTITSKSKKHDWLLRMNRRLTDVPIGELDPATTPISAIMNSWAKTKSSHGASMVEKWLDRAQEEYDVGNTRIVPTNKMFTMAVDAWAKSGEGVNAAQRAEAILQHMHKKYQITGHEHLRPTTGIFNAVINAWARSKEKIAPSRAEQILQWMENLHRKHPGIRPDKYTFNTVIHAYAKSGDAGAAKKSQDLLNKMQMMYEQGNELAKPDTITYNVVINSLAKSGGKSAAKEAEKLLGKMHNLYENGDAFVKPNVVTYGAVIDAYAKSGEKFAAARADALLAKMIHLNQMDPRRHSDLRPNTYVFNTVINAHAKSKEHDAASKAEEMLLAMNRLHVQGMPNLKPDAFTYTAVIDAWAKSGYRGAAARADQLLDEMESKYLAGDMGLKPNTFTYNAVINALAKSGEPSAAARAERVLHNMVNRHKHGGSDDVKPTTINFNSVLDAWAKSGGGRKAAERAEEILEWMDRLYNGGNYDVRPDTITFNAVLDAWARSGDRVAAHRAEQILDHMDELYRSGNVGVKPDTYTYNTLINAHAKSSEKGSAARAEHVLKIMQQRYLDGDGDFKPNTRTHTSVIDAWAKSGEKGAARRAEQILNNMIVTFGRTGDHDSKPNVHTANAVCNACAFTKRDEDRQDALQIAFRVYDWLDSQPNMEPDAYTYTILLSVCSNLIPREDRSSRFSHAKSFFEKCCESGHVNDYVLRKLRQTVTEQEYLTLVDYQGAGSLPPSWTRKVGHRNVRIQKSSGGGSSVRSKNSNRSNHSKRRDFRR